MVLALALGAGACAHGVVDEPGDDDDDTSGGAQDIGGSQDPGGSTNVLPGGGGSGGDDVATSGACYTGAGQCNPMQSDCASGEACDATADQGFVCFPPPNDVQVGGVCDPTAGPFCEAGSTCVSGTCRAYCCTSVDCAFGTCQDTGAAGGVTLRACTP